MIGLKRKPILILIVMPYRSKTPVVFFTETRDRCNNLSVLVTVMYRWTGFCSRWCMWQSTKVISRLTCTSTSTPEHNTRPFSLNIENEKSKTLPPIPFLQSARRGKQQSSRYIFQGWGSRTLQHWLLFLDADATCATGLKMMYCASTPTSLLQSTWICATNQTEMNANVPCEEFLALHLPGLYFHLYMRDRTIKKTKTCSWGRGALSWIERTFR